jgi:competence protein ComEC
MVVVAVALLIGAKLTALAPELPDARLAAFLLAVGCALAIVMRKPAPGWVIVGGAWFVLAAQSALEDRLPEDGAGDYTVTGRVIGVPDLAGSPVRFLFEPDAAGRARGLPRRLRLSWYDAPVYPDPGLRWRLRVRLRPPSGLANPGTFDFERWLLERRIGATGYVRPASANGPIGSAGVRGRLANLRRAAAAATLTALGDGPAGGIVTAVTLGLRSGLDDETRRVLRVTGTAHLMAISGLHVGMVAGLGMLLGRLAWSGVWRLWPGPPRGPSRRAAGAVAGWLCAAAYTLVAGAGIPARRALIMLTVLLLMLAGRRRLGPAAPVAAAAIVLFVLDPLTVLSPGFWLSLTAVAGLVAAGAGRLVQPGGGRGLVAAQWAVGLALLLPGLMIFGGLPLYGPLVNLVAVPLFGLAVVPLALAGLLLLPMSPALAAALWAPLGWLLPAGLDGLGSIASLPGAWLQPPRMPAWMLGVAGAAAGALLLPVGRIARLALLLALLPALSWQPVPLPAGAYRVTALDVGQGLAVVVRTRGHALLFDAGPRWRSGRDAGAAVVLPWLKSAGVDRLDGLVVSHGDNDHRGGVASVAAGLPVRRRWVGPDVPSGPLTKGADACGAGVAWRWDGVDFRFLHPPPTATGGGNDSSCVLLIAGRGGRTLLSGDIEAPAEARLVASRIDLGADLVIAPHHGSRTSSTPALVAATAPRWVVVPAGYGNRWGFPAPEVSARWRAVGAEIQVVGEQGAVEAEFGPAGVAKAPTGWRCAQRRFWRRSDCPPRRVPGTNDSQYDAPDPGLPL